MYVASKIATFGSAVDTERGSTNTIEMYYTVCLPARAGI